MEERAATAAGGRQAARKEGEAKTAGLEEEARWRQRALKAEAEVDAVSATLTTTQQEKLAVQEELTKLRRAPP